MSDFERLLRDAICGAAQAIAKESTRPSVLFRPVIAQDGNAFIALLGDNLQIGVVGCGATPAEAMADFDVAWTRPAKVLGTR